MVLEKSSRVEILSPCSFIILFCDTKASVSILLYCMYHNTFSDRVGLVRYELQPDMVLEH